MGNITVSKHVYDDLLDLARNVGGTDDHFLTLDVKLLRATLREFIDQARAVLDKTD